MMKHANTLLAVCLLGLLLVLLSACQVFGEEATATPTSPVVVASPSLMPTEVPAIAPTSTAAPTEVIEPTITSPVATPTSPPIDTPSPTPLPTAAPLPEPTIYIIESGDSLLAIAERFNVSIDAILYANGYASLDELALIAGSELQIPLCEAHRVASGNTLSGIAQLCDVTLDDLVKANLSVLAPLGNLDAVPVGFVLLIPPPSDISAAPLCAEQPEREQVIEYTPLPEEGLFCLATMFGLSPNTILQANTQRLTGDNVYGEQPLLIAPANGAVIVISDEDITNGMTVADIAAWYEVAPESVEDWNGNPVADPLTAGQQLFVRGADLSFGVFASQLLVPGDANDNVNDNGDANSNDNVNDNVNDNSNGNENSG